MPRRSARHRVAKGIFRDDMGFAVRVEVAKHREEKRYSRDTDLRTMKDWQAERRVELRRRYKARTAEPGSFAADATRYLEAVRAMPTIAERRADIRRWCEVFGARRRQTIDASEISAVMNRWATEPRGAGEPPYAASTLNHRRTALLHLYAVLDGKAAVNPVRDVKKFREPDPQPRGYDYPTIRRILAHVSRKSAARLAVLAYTGIPPAQLMTVDPGHVNWAQSYVWLHGRRKGGGTRSRFYPLTPEGLGAFRLLDREEAWGRYSRSSLWKAFRRACAAAGAPIGRVYDLRHSFATELYRVSDRGAAQAMLDHQHGKTSDRYILGALAQHVSAALPKLALAQENGAPKRGATKKRA